MTTPAARTASTRPRPRPAPARGFVTMAILLVAAAAILLLDGALTMHRHLLTANRRLAAEIQQRADAWTPPATPATAPPR